jgi:hypothetical protein
VVLAAPAATAQVKTLKMPPPAADSATKQAREDTAKLFLKGGPATGDVAQGSIATCPLASLLAALAHVPNGRKFLQGMVAEHPAVVVTDLSGVAGDLDSPPKDNKILSKRYFSVTLAGQLVEVSDVFYTDDADRNWSRIYMQSLTNALWPPVIEKAYAALEGSYQKLNNRTLTANQVWRDVVGSDPEILAVTDQTDLPSIRTALAGAPKVPTIAASRDDAPKVTSWHGFAVLGVHDSTVELYDPGQGDETVKLSLQEFRSNFKAILHGSP